MSIVIIALTIIVDKLVASSDIVGKYNPYNGMQTSAAPFEFVNKPTVRKAGSNWLITFTTKSECDVTVAVTDVDGKIVRHLASGVLGKNAPYPFKQSSLSQTIEWDGKDDNGNFVTTECKVKVSLGLTAEFDKIEKQHLFSGIRGMGVDKEGELYVAMANGILSESVHVFDRQGKMILQCLVCYGRELVVEKRVINSKLLLTSSKKLLQI